MKTKALLSRIALLLSILLLFSTIAACDGFSDRSEDEEVPTNTSSLRLTVYDGSIPAKHPQLDDKAWKPAEKMPLLNKEPLEPGYVKTYIALLRNEGEQAEQADFYFKIKGELGKIAEVMTVTIFVSDFNTNDPVGTASDLPLSELLSAKNLFLTSVIEPGAAYLISMRFKVSESASAEYAGTSDIGAKIYLACDSRKVDTTDSECEVTTDSYKGEDVYLNDEKFNWDSSTISTAGGKCYILLNIKDSGYLRFYLSLKSTNAYGIFIVELNGQEHSSFGGNYSNEFFVMPVSRGDRIRLIYTSETPGAMGDWASAHDVCLRDYAEEDTVPDDTTPEESVFESATEGGASDESISEDVSSEESVPEDVASEESIPEDADADDFENGSIPEADEESEFESIPIETQKRPKLDSELWSYQNTDKYVYGTVTDEHGNLIDVWASQNHDDNSKATLSFNIYQRGKVSFSVRVPCEYNHDKLTVYVNKKEYYGETHPYVFTNLNTWSESLTVEVYPGDVLSFVYTKDASVNLGEDCAYIRNLQFTPVTDEETTDNVEDTSAEKPFDPMDFESNFSYRYQNMDYGEVHNSLGETHMAFYTINNTRDTYALLVLSPRQDGYVKFQFSVTSENPNDVFYIMLNGEGIFSTNEKNEYFDNYSIPLTDEDLLEIYYYKGSNSDYGSDFAMIRNLAFFPGDVEAPDAPVAPDDTEIPEDTVAPEDTTEPEETQPESSGKLEFIDIEYFSTYTYDYNGKHQVWYTTNEGLHDTTATLAFYAPADGYISFDFTISSEGGCDLFIVYVNGGFAAGSSGNTSTQLEPATIEVSAGDYVQFTYTKDSEGNGGVDKVTITDIKFHRYD